MNLLRAKLVEEALEFFWTTDNDEAIQELADLLEVVEATIRQLGHDLPHLQALAQTKRDARGGFDQGIVLLETIEVPLTRVLQSREDLFGIEVEEPATTGGLPPRSARRQLRPDAPIAPTRKGDDIVLPLVPPIPGPLPARYTIEMPGTGESFTVSYFAKEIRVTLRKPPKLPSHDDQLPLPGAQG
jgi:hypothetical protein